MAKILLSHFLIGLKLFHVKVDESFTFWHELTLGLLFKSVGPFTRCNNLDSNPIVHFWHEIILGLLENDLTGSWSSTPNQELKQAHITRQLCKQACRLTPSPVSSFLHATHLCVGCKPVGRLRVIVALLDPDLEPLALHRVVPGLSAWKTEEHTLRTCT